MARRTPPGRNQSRDSARRGKKKVSPLTISKIGSSEAAASALRAWSRSRTTSLSPPSALGVTTSSTAAGLTDFQLQSAGAGN